jgi:hypothetical protein
MTEMNMVPFLSRLSQKEKLVICFLCNKSGQFQSEVHLGLLPFLPARDVVRVVRQADALGDVLSSGRIIKEILVKCAEAGEPDESTCSFYMQLDTKKVHKHFGRNPERGKPLPHLPKQKVTVGVKWSLPKKKWVPDRDVLVAPCVTLRLKAKTRDGGPRWQVQTLTRCRAAVELWLMQNCR